METTSIEEPQEPPAKPSNNPSEDTLEEPAKKDEQEFIPDIKFTESASPEMGTAARTNDPIENMQEKTVVVAVQHEDTTIAIHDKPVDTREIPQFVFDIPIESFVPEQMSESLPTVTHHENVYEPIMNMVFRSEKNLEQGTGADSFTETVSTFLKVEEPELKSESKSNSTEENSSEVDFLFEDKVEQPNEIAFVQDNHSIEEITQEKRLSQDKSNHEPKDQEFFKQEGKRIESQREENPEQSIAIQTTEATSSEDNDLPPSLSFEAAPNIEVGNTPIENKDVMQNEKPTEILESILHSTVETFATEAFSTPSLVESHVEQKVKDEIEDQPKLTPDITTEITHTQDRKGDTVAKNLPNQNDELVAIAKEDTKQKETTSNQGNEAVKHASKETGNEVVKETPKEMVADNSKKSKIKDQESIRPPQKKAKAIEYKLFIKSQEAQTTPITPRAEQVKTLARIETTSKLEEALETIDASPIKKRQSTEKTNKEKMDEIPQQIAVSEKMFAFIENLMDKTNNSVEPIKQQITTDTKDKKTEENGEKQHTVKEKASVLKVAKNKETITLSSQHTDIQNGDQKTETQKLTQITRVEELGKAFDYIRKLTVEGTGSKDEPSKATSKEDKKKISEVKIVVSEKLLDVIKDAREKVFALPKIEEKNDEIKQPLPVTFSTENEDKKQLTVNSREVVQIQQFLVEQHIITEDNQNKKALEALPNENSFDSRVTIFELKKRIKGHELPNETEKDSTLNQYVELISDDNLITIEIAKLKKLIDVQKKKDQKKEEDKNLLINNTNPVIEELIQEDGQTQMGNNSSLLLQYQLLLLLLSLPDRPHYDEIYHAQNSYSSTI